MIEPSPQERLANVGETAEFILWSMASKKPLLIGLRDRLYVLADEWNYPGENEGEVGGTYKLCFDLVTSTGEEGLSSHIEEFPENFDDVLLNDGHRAFLLTVVDE